MTILQRNEDWHADRCGKVTASRVKDLDAKPKAGKAHNALTLTILTERLTGVQEESFTNSAMQWGIDQEIHAITAYENETGNFVIGTGLVNHPAIKWSGASLDGLVDQDGQLEVKCPNSQTHLNTILTKEVPIRESLAARKIGGARYIMSSEEVELAYEVFNDYIMRNDEASVDVKLPFDVSLGEKL